MLLIATIGLFLAMLPGSLQLADDPGLERVICEAAQSVLAERFPSRAEHFSVRVERIGGDLDVDGKIRIEIPPTDILPEAYVKSDILTPTTPGAWEKRGWALLYVSHFDSVMIAHREVEANGPVTTEDLETVWMEVTKFRGQPLRRSDLDNHSGPIFATRRIREGQVLKRPDLRPPYAAEIGQNILMHYERGPMSFDIPCEARESGFSGDIIRIYSSDTKKMYRARLSADGTAEWIETL